MASGALFRRPAVMLALALCSVGAVVTLMGRLASGPRVEQKKIQLSSDAGSESYPSFSPDGKRLAYSARDVSKVSAFHIFTRELPSGTPVQLTRGEASDVAPVFAPDGGTLAAITEDGVVGVRILEPAKPRGAPSRQPGGRRTRRQPVLALTPADWLRSLLKRVAAAP